MHSLGHYVGSAGDSILGSSGVSVLVCSLENMLLLSNMSYSRLDLNVVVDFRISVKSACVSGLTC